MTVKDTTLGGEITAHTGLKCTFQPDPRVTLIGDSFTKAVQGMSSHITVQNRGKATLAEMVRQLKQKEIDLEYDVVVFLAGGLQILNTPIAEIVQSLEQMVLTVRNQAPNSYILVSTLLYRPRDDTLLKERIDVVNSWLEQMVVKLAKVGCRVFLISSHKVLVSLDDQKLIRPIHVYFQDGFFPSKSSGTLLASFICKCAVLVVQTGSTGLV